MSKSITVKEIESSQRLLSLDFLRGVVMVILILGETGIFSKIQTAFPNEFTSFLFTQFRHSQWRGLHFWDLLLPTFMLLSGTSLAFSYAKQQRLHYTWGQSFRKVLKRCFWLLFWGVLIYAARGDRLNIQFSNVLVELSVATLISFALIRFPATVQFAVSIGLLLVTEFLFRFTNIEGFNQSFVDQHNFGNYIDLLTIGRLNPGYGTTFNVIPSAVNTIWGVIAGQLLLSEKKPTQKIQYLSVFGMFALATGFLLDIFNITPMLKWIASSSFVIATAGISLLALTLCYWWVDVKNHRRYLFCFIVMGMNSIFVYLLFSFIGGSWMSDYCQVLVGGLFSLVTLPVIKGSVLACLVVFLIHWAICFYLYKKKIFFKL